MELIRLSRCDLASLSQNTHLIVQHSQKKTELNKSNTEKKKKERKEKKAFTLQKKVGCPEEQI